MRGAKPEKTSEAVKNAVVSLLERKAPHLERGQPDGFPLLKAFGIHGWWGPSFDG